MKPTPSTWYGCAAPQSNRTSMVILLSENCYNKSFTFSSTPFSLACELPLQLCIIRNSSSDNTYHHRHHHHDDHHCLSQVRHHHRCIYVGIAVAYNHNDRTRCAVKKKSATTTTTETGWVWRGRPAGSKRSFRPICWRCYTLNMTYLTIFLLMHHSTFPDRSIFEFFFVLSPPK